jgi:hypothetical protein
VPALSFSPQFASLVESGAKTQTIRAPRKRPIAVGERVYLYTGPYRAGERRKIGEGLVVAVDPIRIEATGKVYLAGVLLDLDARMRFARADGFESYTAFLDWFVGADRVEAFDGSLIRWRLLPREEWKR